jgi:hypothetical protein
VSAFLPGNFFRAAYGLTIADGGGVTWSFDKTTNTLSVSGVSGTGLAADSVSNTELTNMAQATVKGRAAAAGTGDPQDLTASQVKTILALTSADLSDFTEAAQDAVLNAGTDSTTIDFTYNDGANTWTVTVIDDSISDAKLRNSGALSVIGRAANSSGDPADISSSSNDTLLRRTASTLNWGQLTAGMFPNTVVPDAALSSNVPLLNGTNNFTGTLQTGGVDVGYKYWPNNLQPNTYAFVLADNGKMVQHANGSNHTYTIPPNSSVAFPIGAQIQLVARSGGTLTIARGVGVALFMHGTVTDSDKTMVGSNLMIAWITQVGTDLWVAHGDIT